MISAHADEVGFQVIKINDDGTFLVSNSGIVSAVMLNNNDVYVKTSKGILYGAFYPKKELGNNTPDNFTEIFLDTMDNDAVQIGDFGSYTRVFYHNNQKILATGLDNKIGVELILELVQENLQLLKQVLFSFVNEEETTYNGIDSIGHQYKPA